MKIVIRAGGTGTRLWPWSRAAMPKQFLPMFDGESCVQAAWHRFVGSGLVCPEDLYVSVGRAHETLARGQLPALDPDHLIVEPDKRDTAAAIGLETVVIAAQWPDVTIASLGSDHYCGKPRRFIEALRAAEKFLTDCPEHLLAIACEPMRIETNYGHIKRGEKLWEGDGIPVFQAEEFTEKPNYPTAKGYTESGDYLWNSNFFVWRADTLLAQFEEFEPELHSVLMAIRAAIRTGQFQEVLERVYPTIKKVAVDYAVVEPAARRGRLAVLPVDMEWSDIGSWGTLTDAFPPDEQGDLFVGPVLAEDTRNTTVLVKNPHRKVVAVVGLEGLAVVDTEDVLLVCPKELSDKVKKLVERVQRDPEWQAVV